VKRDLKVPLVKQARYWRLQVQLDHKVFKVFVDLLDIPVQLEFEDFRDKQELQVFQEIVTIVYP
jgi:hypothetical protein